MISPEIAWDARMIDCASSSAFDGEAVAIGMARAARLARDLGRVPTELVARQDRLLTALELPTAPPAGPGMAADRLLDILLQSGGAQRALFFVVEHGALRPMGARRSDEVAASPLDEARDVCNGALN